MRRAFPLLLLALIYTVSCVEAGVFPPLYIVGNKKHDSECTFSSEAVGTYIGRGVLDLVMKSNYTLGALVQNQLVDTTVFAERQETDGRVNVSAIELTRASVTYQFPAGGGLEGLGQQNLAGFTTFISGTVNPQGSKAVPIHLFSPAMVTALTENLPPRDSENPFPEGLVLTRVTLHGTTLDGSEIESSEFTFPVRVCKGCLLSFPAAAVLGEGNPNCRNLEGADAIITECQGFLGQDEAYDCRLCRLQKPIALRNECEPL